VSYGDTTLSSYGGYAVAQDGALVFERVLGAD
jgi:hypothetical protein